MAVSGAGSGWRARTRLGWTLSPQSFEHMTLLSSHLSSCASSNLPGKVLRQYLHGCSPNVHVFSCAASCSRRVTCVQPCFLNAQEMRMSASMLRRMRGAGLRSSGLMGVWHSGHSACFCARCRRMHAEQNACSFGHTSGSLPRREPQPVGDEFLIFLCAIRGRKTLSGGQALTGCCSNLNTSRQIGHLKWMGGGFSKRSSSYPPAWFCEMRLDGLAAFFAAMGRRTLRNLRPLCALAKNIPKRRRAAAADRRV